MVNVTSTGGGMAEWFRALDFNSITPALAPVVLSSPVFNSSVMLVNSHLVRLLPVGILTC